MCRKVEAEECPILGGTHSFKQHLALLADAEFNRTNGIFRVIRLVMILIPSFIDLKTFNIPLGKIM